MDSKVLVIGGGLWQIPLIKYLRNKKHLVYVVDPYLDSLGVKYADKQIVCDVREADKIYEQIKNEKFELICSDQSDISVNTVSILNEKFGLRGNSYEITNRFVNKYNMRELAIKLGIPSPQFSKIFNSNDLLAFIKSCKLPVILKPVDSQSSRGVIKINENNLSQIDEFVAYSLQFSNCEYLIAEEFVDGEEVTVEGYASNNKHRTLAISLKKHFRTGVASELRYPADIPHEMYEKLEKYNDKFVENSGLKFGITHSEYIINRNTGDIKIIEIACRGGGTLISSDIIKWVSGIDVYDFYYKSLKGADVDLSKIEVKKRNAILKFFEFNKGEVASIAGVKDIMSWKEIVSFDLSFKEGDLLKLANDDRTRQGYFIAKANTKEELDEIIEKVNKTLIINYK